MISSKVSSIPPSLSSPNLSKQDSGSSTGSSSRLSQDLINFNEDYSRSIEERERRMDERRPSNSRASSVSSNNGELRTPRSKKRNLQLPNAPNREIKPSTILRLEDRDLIVIDKQDIKEAVKNESQVIIVDPPAAPSTPSEANEHVDLGDILAGDWPELAGGAATLLNADKKSGQPPTLTGGWRTIERNKSANIASHFSSSKPRRSGYENGLDSNAQKKSKLSFLKRVFFSLAGIFSQTLRGNTKIFLDYRLSHSCCCFFFAALKSIVS